ncbi:CAP domain-containing protein [Streptomyces sp. NPDC002851]
MGRHRRLDPGSAAADRRAAGTASRRGAGTHRRKKRAAAPVRTGLLGASAAVAMGAVAVASGLIPGPVDGFGLGDGGKESGKVRAAGSSPTDLETQGSSIPDRKEPAASRDSERPEPTPSKSSANSPSPEKSSANSSSPSAKPSKKPSDKADSGDADRAEDRTSKPKAPPKTPSATPEKTAPSAPATNTEVAAEAEVLSLVNKERAQKGCSPVRPDAELAELAGDFSEAMAEDGFFDHTDPSGRTPWDRAAAAGITDLGGENIARGQANAQSVMDSWMNSPGHRANILNCEYKTLGVGAHFAPGGPWWTQDFGF